MIDHTGVATSNFEASKAFYCAALRSISYEKLVEFPLFQGEVEGGVAGFGVAPKPDFWIHAGTPNNPPIHVAFRASSRAEVDQFYQDALGAGGRDNGKPGLRPHYHPNYYAAFVLDPDGHNIEVVCHDSV